MRPISGFDTFLAGVALFLAGVLFAGLMAFPGWTPHDLQYGVYGIAAVGYGVWRLHSLYRNQNTSQASRPAT